MLGQAILDHTWTRPTKPVVSVRPTAGQSLGWGGASATLTITEERDQQASHREALIQSFRHSMSDFLKGLGGGALQGRLLILTVPTQGTTTVSRRRQELAWREAHQQLLRTLAGQWVVVEGDALIGSGQDPAALVAAARQQGIQTPYVFFVEPLAQDTVKIGL